MFEILRLCGHLRSSLLQKRNAPVCMPGLIVKKELLNPVADWGKGLPHVEYVTEIGYFGALSQLPSARRN